MVYQAIAATFGDNIEGVTAFGPHPARGYAGTVERIVGIVHLIHSEDGFQTALVEGLVVGHEGKTGNLGLYLLPYLGKDGSIYPLLSFQARFKRHLLLV